MARDVRFVTRHYDMRPALAYNRLWLEDAPPELRDVSAYLRPDHRSELLKEQLRTARTPVLDYKEQALTFNRAFFLRNYLKSLVYLRSLPFSVISHLGSTIDIGGGAGPFSFAVKTERSDVMTTLLDSSAAQISIAQLLSDFVGLRHIWRSLIADVFQARLCPTTPRLFSYWLCENRITLDTIPVRRKLFGQLSVVIDYPDVVAREVAMAGRLGYHARHFIVAEDEVCSRLAEMIGQRNITYGAACLEL